MSGNDGFRLFDFRNRRPYLTTTTSPNNDIDEDHVTNKESVNKAEAEEPVVEEASSFEESHSDGGNDLAEEEEQEEEKEETASTGSFSNEMRLTEDPIVGRLMTGAGNIGMELKSVESSPSMEENEETEKRTKNAEEIDEEEEERKVSIEVAKSTRPDDIPDITSLFTDGPIVPRKETAFDGLQTHEIRSSSRSNNRGKLEHREIPDGSLADEKSVNEAVASEGSSEESHTIGPYDSVQEDYPNDQPDEDRTSDTASVSSSLGIGATGASGNEKDQQQQDEDSSTFLPEAEPDYRYNMKWRSMGKVLDPPSN